MDSYHPTYSWLPEERYRICYPCQATDHWTSNCPIQPSPSYQDEARGNSSFVEPSWGSNQWTQDTESLRQYVDSHGEQQGFGSNVGQSSGARLDTQKDKLFPDGVLESLHSMAALMERMQERTEQNMARITELEKAQLGNDQVIKEQATQVESLEATVQKLETRLKHQQNEQSQRHEANLRRIKQIHIEVLRLREQLGRVDSKVHRVHEEQVKYIHSNHKDDSSDDMTDYGEDLGIGDEHDISAVGALPTHLTETGGCNSVVPLSATNEISGLDDVLGIMENFLTEQPAGALNAITLGNWFNGQLKESGHPRVIESAECVNKVADASRALVDKVTSLPPFAINEERGSDLDYDDFLRPSSEYSEYTPVENVNTEGISCGCCGLHCHHQLRACVNMIRVLPSMSKVKEKEIRALKRTKKRKLQRLWVPRGIFDVKELFKVNTVSEDQCARSYMPRWRKRKRRPPATNDSCD